MCLLSYSKRTEISGYVATCFIDAKDGARDIIPGPWRSVVGKDMERRF